MTNNRRETVGNVGCPHCREQGLLNGLGKDLISERDKGLDAHSSGWKETLEH